MKCQLKSMRILTFCFCLFTFSSQAQLTKYVNPFIGTGGTGHTFPGATTPFAMVQLSPDTRIDGSWEGCSGYHYNDSIIYGFSHTHLSGTGCSDYGDIAFMPYFSKNGDFDYVKNNLLQAKFSHKNERASAGYYSVLLDDIPVKIELTATTRTGFQRYTYNEDGYGYIVLNLKHRDELLEGKVNHSIDYAPHYTGIRRSKAWAKNQELYYAFDILTELNKQALTFSHKDSIVKGSNNDEKIIFSFKVFKGQQILISTALSSCDEFGAIKNLEQETYFSANFDFVKQQAQQSWEKELKKIEVFDKSETNKTIFYTAMYHCMIHPSIMNDVDGRYKGRDGKIHKAEGFNYYTVFSLWDTHRALHPLLNIIDKKRSHDFVITFLKQFEQSGRLPMWELWNNETDCMIGFHSVSVILDAYRKQVITKAELQQLWPAVKAEAMSNRFGLDKFREKGYLSVEDESESVSKTLEYSYDMWCVSEIANILDKIDDYIYFSKYIDSELELFNVDNNFFQPKKNGNFISNFNPFEVNNNYTEANAWQYNFYSPQATFRYKLIDSLFLVENKTQGRTQADITGLIGQYAHGNEPSHNYIYLLNEPNRIKYLRYVYDNFYTNNPDGLIGNEDCGQMSAWYVMSALGFYQTCPGKPEYKKGLTIFDSTIIHLENKKNVYLTDKYYKQIPLKFNHSLVFDRKANADKINYSSSRFHLMSPIIKSDFIKPFTDSLKVEINKSKVGIDNPPYLSEKIKTSYSINDSDFIDYDKPFYIKKNSVIKAYSWLGYCGDTNDDPKSNLSTAHFYKRPHNYSIQLNCKYNKQYTADGDDGIIDGQFGDIDWKKGGWQGYQSQDFEAIIDMKEVKQFEEISANFLQDTRSWILFPKKVEFYISTDSINFKLAETIENTISPQDYNVQTQKLKVKTQKEFSTARYIKVKAYNYGKLPEWHAGKGDDAFIFIDEIEIK